MGRNVVWIFHINPAQPAASHANITNITILPSKVVISHSHLSQSSQRNVDSFNNNIAIGNITPKSSARSNPKPNSSNFAWMEKKETFPYVLGSKSMQEKLKKVKLLFKFLKYLQHIELFLLDLMLIIKVFRHKMMSWARFRRLTLMAYFSCSKCISLMFSKLFVL